MDCTLLSGWAPGVGCKCCLFPKFPGLAVYLCWDSCGLLLHPRCLAHTSFLLVGEVEAQRGQGLMILQTQGSYNKSGPRQ